MNSVPILFAPNLHCGGGLVLLKALLDSWEPAQPLLAFLDQRVRDIIVVPSAITVQWVAPRVSARIAAQKRLRAESSEATIVLCFNGLPPLLANRGHVVVFQQNRLHLVALARGEYALKVALRLSFERFVSHALRHRVQRYVVQTPSMGRALANWLGEGKDGAAEIAVVPFTDTLGVQVNGRQTEKRIEWDFIYVADGMPHKNHRTLCEAWRLLADEGIRLRLALTLAPEETHLLELIANLRDNSAVEIVNLGRLPHDQVLAMYGRTRALIFPSVTESFGLPLLEARQAGLPIIASELDFVRDVCSPAQTFDPHSAVSIARAVRRFLGLDEVIVEPVTARAFWDHVMSVASR